MLNNQFKKGELYSFITGKASTAVARRLQKNFKESAIDITIEQWSVLYHLWKEDGRTQQQLCDATFRDKPSITRLVDNLEKSKLPFFLFVLLSIGLTVASFIKKLSLIPVLGLASCFYLMTELGYTNWLRFLIWLVIGLVIYFLYSRKHSKLTHKS